MGAFSDITAHLPRGSRMVYDPRSNQHLLFVHGVLIGTYDQDLLYYSTHMEYDRFFQDLRVELKMPRKLEESRLWC